MPDNSEKKFHVRWKVETGEWTLEQVTKEGEWFSSDALVHISIAKGPVPFEGPVSQIVSSIDGRTGRPLDPRELFRTWMLMGADLVEQPGLQEWQRRVLQTSIDMIRSILTVGGNKPGGTPPAQA